MGYRWNFFALLLCGFFIPFDRAACSSSVCISPYYGYMYQTCTDIRFSIKQQIFVIPKGFKTDLASIPRVSWLFIAPAHSLLIKPSIIHDWLYQNGCIFERKKVDAIFYRMLIDNNVSFFKASIMYYAVRIFGWKFYKKESCHAL